MHSDFSQKQMPTTIRSLGYIPPLIRDPNLDPTKPTCMAIGEGICGWIRNPALDEEKKDEDQQSLPTEQTDPDSASCTPIYGSTNPFALNMNEIIGYDCSGGGSTSMPQSDPQSDPDSGVAMSNEMFPDDLMVQQPVEDDACEGVRCIKLYKPCPEGYIDGNKCCPNTGNCVLDPNYVIPNVGLVQMQPIAIAAPALPIGQTPSTNFDIETEFPIAQPIRSSTPLPFERTTTASTTSTTATPTTETSTAEEPKEGGLGILVLGLIALEALAT